VGSRLVTMATSMNHLLPPIEDSFTCQSYLREEVYCLNNNCLCRWT
jgi:hypothetical protein